MEDSAVEDGFWAVQGKSAKLICRAKAAPEPKFHWTNNKGVELENTHKYKIHQAKVSSIYNRVTATTREYVSLTLPNAYLFASSVSEELFLIEQGVEG